MTKKLSAICILALIIFAFLAVSSFAMTEDDRIKGFNTKMLSSVPKAKLAGAEAVDPFGYTDVKQSVGFDAATKRGLGDPSPGFQLGTTSYDYQSNGRNNRLVDWRSSSQNVHFDWMIQDNYNLGSNRGTAYIYWNAVTGLPGFGGVAQNVHAREGTEGYSGYVGLDVTPDDRAIIGNHWKGSGAADIYSSVVWFDFTPLGGFFSVNQCELPHDISDYSADDTSQFIWPSMDYQIYDGDTVTHIFSQESLEGINPQKIHYFRRLGGPDISTCIWDDPPLVVDTVNCIAQTVTSSRTSGKVALVWTANPGTLPGDAESEDRGFQLLNDVYYMISNDMGATWPAGKVNLTKFDSSQAGWAAYTDLSALISTDDNLHIIWQATETSPGTGDIGSTLLSNYYGCRLFHWGEGNPTKISVVKDANWQLTFDYACTGGSWNHMSIAKMQISECDGKF
jgi:hypothetical protein